MQSRNPIVAPFHDRLLTALLFFFALMLVSPASAQFGGYERHLAGTLVAETHNPAPGETVMLAFEMKPDPGWHGYWENPGDAGLGMTAEWTLPPGVKAGALEYPVPGTLILSGLMNHVYERDYAVLVPLTIPADAVKGTVIPVRVKAQALVCDDKLCLPQDFDLSTRLTVGDGAIDAASRARFDAWRAKLPRPLTLAPRDALYELTPDKLRIGVKVPQSLALSDLHLFAATTDVIDYAAPQRFTRNGDWLVMEGKPRLTDGVTVDGIDSLLRIGPDKGLRFTAAPAKTGELPTGGTTVGGPVSAGFDFKLLLIAFGGALLGGLLLNIMPCVFPILSLKAISISRAGGDRATVRREAWAYAAGVIAVCLALGLVLLGLRAAGEQVGWAFQLQNPVMVFLLLLLVAGITANLAGLFEIGGPSFNASGTPRGGTAGAFLTGALAAIVATPCTGPFMGAALGATMVLPGWAALVIFGGLGIGIALPFLLIAYSDSLRAKLPKPGAWMEKFRRWMAVPMALTALALMWLLWRMTGMSGLIMSAIALLLFFASLTIIGRRQAKGRSLGLLPCVLIGAGIGIGLAYFAAYAQPKATAAATLSGKLYSAEALAAARKAGKPVFVYFTADWCVTCKINEAAAINRTDTDAAFKAGAVTVLVGDWTNGDADITRALAEQGRNSVPLYLWYRPDADKPEVLPQILTPSMLTTRAEAT